MLDLSDVTSALHNNQPQPHRNLNNIEGESRLESRVYSRTPMGAMAAARKTERSTSDRVEKI